MKQIFAFLFVLFAASTVFAANPSACDTTVLIVRHAEASSGSDDPELTEKGIARAARLAEVAKDAGVTVAYVTHLRRTRDTVMPLVETSDAKLIEVAVDRVAIKEQTIALGKRILAEHAGQTVLVAGHSNTVPMLLEALGANAVPEIAHDEHDRLYVVIVREGAPVRVIAARY
ncbi:MAG TPA: phosphoglycerate mutase family protein [Thermoanaerobaculia bacterium]